MAAILSVIEPETVPFDPPTPKTYRTKHELDRDRVTSCGDMAIRNSTSEGCIWDTHFEEGEGVRGQR